MSTIIHVSVIVIPIIISIVAFWLFGRTKGQGLANDSIEHIGQTIQKGAYTLLGTRYFILARFATIIALLILVFIPTPIWKGSLENIVMALSFLAGGAFAALVATVGVAVATLANRSTAIVAESGPPNTFNSAFRGGAAIGLSVASLGIVGIAIVYYVTGSAMSTIGVSFGATIFGLFAKADEGAFAISAEMMGFGGAKDEWRTVACVGTLSDVGSNLFCFSCASLGAALAMAPSSDHALMIFLFALIGLVSSAITAFTAQMGERGQSSHVLRRTLLMTVGLFVALSGGVCWYLSFSWRLWGATVSGTLLLALLALLAKGRPQATHSKRRLSIIGGVFQARRMRRGLVMTIAIIAVVSASMLLCAPHGPDYARLGIALAAVGILSIVATHISITAYLSIIESAKRLVETAHLGNEAYEVADTVDRSTTAIKAIGADWGMGAAALTSIALFATFVTAALEMDQPLRIMVTTKAGMVYGVLTGVGLTVLFAVMFILGVERTGRRMVSHIHRHLRALRDLPSEEVLDYDRCIDIVTVGAFRELAPANLVAIVVMVSVGFIGGVGATGAVLVGFIASSVVLAAVLTNTGERSADMLGSSIMIQLTAVMLVSTLTVRLFAGVAFP